MPIFLQSDHRMSVCFIKVAVEKVGVRASCRFTNIRCTPVSNFTEAWVFAEDDTIKVEQEDSACHDRIFVL